MQKIGDGRGRSAERPGDRFRAVAFYSPVPNDFLFTRRERSQRAHHGVDGKLAGIPKPLPIAHGGGGNADCFGRAFVSQAFWKQTMAACRFSGGKVVFMDVSKKRGAASLHGTPPFTRQSMPLPDVAETNVPTPVFLHVAAVLLFEVNVGVGVVGPVEVGTDADFVIRAADVVLHRGAH